MDIVHWAEIISKVVLDLYYVPGNIFEIVGYVCIIVSDPTSLRIR